MTKRIVSYIFVLVVGLAIGTWFDAKHTIEQKVVYKDRVRTQIEEVIIERPDGTKETRRTVDKNERSDKHVAKKESKPIKPNWGVGIKYDLFQPQQIWTLEVHRRVFGNAYVSAYGRTDGVAGLGITVFF